MKTSPASCCLIKIIKITNHTALHQLNNMTILTLILNCKKKSFNLQNTNIKKNVKK